MTQEWIDKKIKDKYNNNNKKLILKEVLFERFWFKELKFLISLREFLRILKK